MDVILEDEILATNAIYEPDTLVLDEANGTCVLTVPGSAIALRFRFPSDYPDVPPEIVGPAAAGPSARRGEATEAVRSAKAALESCFLAGQPCMYDLIELLAQSVAEARAKEGQPDAADVDVDADASYDADEEQDGLQNSQWATEPREKEKDSAALIALPPPWTLSEVVTEKKSVFLARCAAVDSPQQAKQYIQHLVTTDKKASKATHNITAWRIRDRTSDATYSDCNDDGEAAAGGRLLHMLQLMDVWNVVVVVSRWYGGIQLGPDRFKLINNTARDALHRSGIFAEERK